MTSVSIIIPTYNMEKYICQAVDSALAQTYPYVEVIIVDDGSTDNTQDVLSNYGQKIKYIYQDNRGHSAARNTGIQASTGDFLLFLDSDDIIFPEIVEIQLEKFSTNPDLGVVYSELQFINSDGSQVLKVIRQKKEGDLFQELLLQRFWLGTGNAIVRRECIERVGGFDESLKSNSDTDFWLRVAKANYHFGYVDRVLFSYRILEGSVTTNVTQEFIDSRFFTLDKVFSDPDLPEEIGVVKDESYAILHFATAARCFLAKEAELGREHICKAIEASPSLGNDEEWLLEWIAATALEPRVDDPLEYLQYVFDNLPSEATVLLSLRERAFVWYHVSAVFSSYNDQNLKETRRHLLPAILGEPSVILNRGFISIGIRSFYGSITP